VQKDEVRANSNILCARFVLAIKQSNTPTEAAQTRYVSQGCGDRESPFIVMNLSTLQQSSTKVIVSTVVVFGWLLLSQDLNQAYQKSKDAMERDIYVKVLSRDAKYIGMVKHEMLRMFKLLYGDSEASDYRDVTFVLHVKEDLVMDPLIGNPALFL